MAAGRSVGENVFEVVDGNPFEATISSNNPTAPFSVLGAVTVSVAGKANDIAKLVLERTFPGLDANKNPLAPDGSAVWYPVSIQDVVIEIEIGAVYRFDPNGNPGGGNPLRVRVGNNGVN